jgi:citrate synthase
MFKRRGRQGPKEMNLNITSLMDILTIILIFLIISFSTDESEVTRYLTRLLKGEAFDKRGDMYGMRRSSVAQTAPGIEILREKAAALAENVKKQEEFQLYCLVERLAPSAFRQSVGNAETISADVDFFNGFIYDCLGIPEDMYIPILAIARIPGWCAQRVEASVKGGRSSGQARANEYLEQ